MIKHAQLAMALGENESVLRQIALQLPRTDLRDVVTPLLPLCLDMLKTNTGLEGLGESWGPAPPKGTYAKYIGTDPFDWMGSPTDIAMNMAVYDLMGKHLGLPAWKLLGPRVRS